MTVSIQATNHSIFEAKSPVIQAGDTVIVYQSRDNLNAIVVTPGQQLNTKYGEFPHSAMIGTQFGSKCPSRKGSGFTYLLRPTPELWTLALPHRTQILYHPDISFVTSQLDIKPGSYVIEAGTGSGSFSHSVARTIGSKGKLFSFEFHEERYTKAAAEFQAHGLLSTVGGPIQLAHQNVIRDGFGDLEAQVDSVFLDLPAPWDALEDAKRVMNRSKLSRICCFSPCIEQVQKTCQTLESLGFSHITMFETLVRTHEPISVVTMKVDDAVRRIKEVETKKQVRRERQILESKQRKLAAQKPQNSTSKNIEEKQEMGNPEDVDIVPEMELEKPQQQIAQNHVMESDGIKPELSNTGKKRTTEGVDNLEVPEHKKIRLDLTGDCVTDLEKIQPHKIYNDEKTIFQLTDSVQEPELKLSGHNLVGDCKLNETQTQNTQDSNHDKKPESNELVKDPTTIQIDQTEQHTTMPKKSGREKDEDSNCKGNKNESVPQQNVKSKAEQIKTQISTLETSKPACMSRGHTSFLTFAVLLPKLK